MPDLFRKEKRRGLMSAARHFDRADREWAG
jgi:hypothetical protein